MIELKDTDKDIMLEALLYYARDKQHESKQGNEYDDVRFDCINKMKADRSYDLYIKLMEVFK